MKIIYLFSTLDEHLVNVYKDFFLLIAYILIGIPNILPWNIIEKSYFLQRVDLNPSRWYQSTALLDKYIDHLASPKKEASSHELNNTVSPIRLKWRQS